MSVKAPEHLNLTFDFETVLFKARIVLAGVKIYLTSDFNLTPNFFQKCEFSGDLFYFPT